ncbi:MAG: dockerin type I repeat-containing protein [Clostridia bacterium]|nr:dockerin type I repeat-containing protein [Clostridia bacterium]
MKKLLSLIAVICCLSLLLCVPVNADATNDVLFEIDAVDDTITVDITTEFSCGAVQGMLTYNGSEIAYSTSSFAEGLATKNSAANSFSDSSGATKVAVVCSATGGVNGNLATLTYTADEGVPAEFSFGSIKAFSANGTKLSNVNAIMVMYGDANGDHLLNIIDLVRYKRILAGQSSVVSGSERNYDLDKDGNRDSEDLAALVTKLLR